MLDWIENNAAFLALIVGSLSVAVPLWALTVSGWRYIDVRQSDQRQRRFENYHRIVDELVTGRAGQAPKVGSQTAAIYELRNYPDYREVSYRILKELQNEWKDSENLGPVIDEISLTLPKLRRRFALPWLR